MDLDFNFPAKIGFIGFGLIGGSIARALKQSGHEYITVASSRSKEPLIMAHNDGVLDIISDNFEKDFSDCNFIFLCTPVITITKYLNTLKDIVGPDCIITDVGSVKTVIHKSVAELGLEKHFIGGHPMTGSELSGYANSSAGIMLNARYVVTPTTATTKEQLDRFIFLISDMKSKPIVMNYELHDKTVAAISHVPHIIAAALAKVVEQEDDDEHHMYQLAAGAFRDVTRVAASSPEMWDQICATNSDAICTMLDEYINTLHEIKDNIQNKTPEYINDLFEHTRSYRNTFDWK